MSDPQIWVLIGVFAAAMTGMITIVTISFSRQLSSAMRGVESQFAAVDARFDAFDVKLDAFREVMEIRFASVERRLDGLDRDVAMLIKRLPAD